jgi:hypothetical protein
MTLRTAIAIVKEHEQWKKGVALDFPSTPKRIGFALDVVIEAAEKSLKG